MKVVLTAPIPGVNIPSFPFGSAIFPGFSMPLLDHQDLQTITLAAESHPLPEQTSNDERRERDLQMQAATIAKKIARHATCRKRTLGQPEQGARRGIPD